MFNDNNPMRAGRSPVLAGLAAFVALQPACGSAMGRAADSNSVSPRAASQPAAAEVARTAIPLNFERNRGQAPADVKYLAHGRTYAIALSERGATLSLGASAASASHAPEVIRLQVRGADEHSSPTAEEPLPGHVNYFVGNDPAKWLTHLNTYGKVRYPGVYPGVDLVYYGTEGKLEYDFAVAPHASARPIALTVVGAEALRVDARGALQVTKGSREITFERPIAYQNIAGQRKSVSAAYRVAGTTVQFQLGDYDHSRALIIDPVLSYFSYVGGSSSDVIGNVPPSVGGIAPQAAALDAAGDLYVTGYTQSTNFPTQSPIAAAPTKTSGIYWAFVSKFSPDAKTLLFSTYIGGTNGDDVAYAIALDANGNAFAVGQTGSTDFPTTAGAYLRICSPTYVNSPNNPYSTCGNNNGAESFVTKLSPAGALLASTFLGGTHTLSAAMAVTTDPSGRPYVVGTTLPGEDIPTGIGGFNQQVGFQTTTGALVKAYPYIANVAINGTLQYDAYVTVFNPTLSALVYSTLFGDNRPQDGVTAFTSQANTNGTAVALDPAGNFYVAGYTADAFVPTTTGALQTTVASCGATFPNQTALNGQCGFVAKFTPVGGASPPALTYGTYFGGEPSSQTANLQEHISGIAVDAAGDAYVVGLTNTTGIPTTTGAYQTTCNGGNNTCFGAFVAELNPAGTQQLAGTYFGCVTCSGDGINAVGAIARDSSGNIYFTGIGGNSLPVVNGFATNNGGGASPFVAELDSTLSTLKFASLLNVGGAGQVSPGGLALDATDAIYLAGNANSPSGSAATTGTVQTSYGGGASDGYVAKIIVTVPTSTTLVVAPTSATTGTSVTFTATVAETGAAGIPTGTVTFANGSTTLGTGTLNSSGMAAFSSSSLAAGSYSVTAAYGGDASNAPSTSSATTLTVTAPAAPTVTITVAPTTITQGASATLTWSSTNATACTASGSWTGTQAVSGTSTVTPSSAGTPSYTLTCTGAGGSANNSASLTVNAQASTGGGSTGGGSTGGGHSGGGSFDVCTLLGLLLLAVQRLFFFEAGRLSIRSSLR